MERMYEKPMMNVERFKANEFASNCGDSGTIYKFTCDGGDGYYGGVWKETNGLEGLQSSGIRVDGKYFPEDTRISSGTGSYHACGTTHEASTSDDFFAGYYKRRGYGDDTAIDVMVWRGPKNNNVHTTKSIDITKWETAKS